MRKVFLGGVIGAIPGLVVALVPLLLHGLGIISADQSQIGFIGVPLLFVGVLVGTMRGAAAVGHSGRVVIGVAIGFAVGLTVGLLIATLMPVVWLVTTPAAMIAGGVLGAWSGERERASRGSRGQRHGAHPRHV